MDMHYTDWDATSCFTKPITHRFLCLASMHVSRKMFMYIYIWDIFYKFACSSIFVNVHTSTRLKSCLFFICMIDWGYNKNKSQYCTGDITLYSNFKTWKIHTRIQISEFYWYVLSTTHKKYTMIALKRVLQILVFNSILILRLQMPMLNQGLMLLKLCSYQLETFRIFMVKKKKSIHVVTHLTASHFAKCVLT